MSKAFTEKSGDEPLDNLAGQHALASLPPGAESGKFGKMVYPPPSPIGAPDPSRDAGRTA